MPELSFLLSPSSAATDMFPGFAGASRAAGTPCPCVCVHTGEFLAATDPGAGGPSSTIADNDKPFFKVVALVLLPAPLEGGPGV